MPTLVDSFQPTPCATSSIPFLLLNSCIFLIAWIYLAGVLYKKVNSWFQEFELMMRWIRHKIIDSIENMIPAPKTIVEI
jgi:hypothetical protein